MPIEIRELLVKATIGDRESERQSGSQNQRAKKEEIIQECVEQVLQILKMQLMMAVVLLISLDMAIQMFGPHIHMKTILHGFQHRQVE